jgi:hypothetical protein
VALYDKQKQKRVAAVTPYLEPGETVRASFLGQSPVPPWAFFFVAPIVVLFFQKYRTVAVTERNIYVMENAFLQTYSMKRVAHKAPLDSARVESGSTWLRVSGGPKLHVPPFGPLKRGLTETRELLGSQRGALPAAPASASADRPHSSH